MFEIVLRIAITYLFLMAVFRLVGKRELSQLSPFELVTLMLVPRAMSDSMTRQSSLINGLTAVSTLFLLVLLTSALVHRFSAVGKMVKPPPTVLVEDGKLVEAALNRERINAGELFGEMHRQGYATLADVKYAILETGGRIAIIPVERAAH